MAREFSRVLITLIASGSMLAGASATLAQGTSIGPKPDDPRADIVPGGKRLSVVNRKAIGPKPEDPLSIGPKPEDPLSIGPKPEDPSSIGPKPEDPLSNSMKGGARASDGRVFIGPKPEDPISRPATGAAIRANDSRPSISPRPGIANQR
jgi:hypothetical protein